MNRPVLALYATREGQTRRIAEHIAAVARRNGHDAAVVDVAHIPQGFSLEDYSAAFLAASVHGARHEKEMSDFVKRHVKELDHLPNAFLSVSLSEVGVEDTKAPPSKREASAVDVQKMIDAFLRETGWRPKQVQPVAGALMYSKYNFFIRYIMKRIARKNGADTDTSRDYEYTNWAAVDALVEKTTAN